MVTEANIIDINSKYENQNSETRVWKYGDRYFICYNALSDMDDISEITEDRVKRLAQSLNIQIA
jgi:hypothetical protein